MRPFDRHRAFAATTAIAMIALIAVMFLAMASALTADGRRTIQHSTDAQLRQMLIAGAAVAWERAGALAQSATTQPIDIPLPPELTSAGGKLQLHPQIDTPSFLGIGITAEWNGRIMNQTLTFARENDKWIPADALLEPATSVRQATIRPTSRPTAGHSPAPQ